MIKYFIYSAMLLVLATSCKVLSQETTNKVEIGSTIPDFSLPDQDGKMFHIKDVLGKKKLVIYFYPKDDTPGCTKEACTFRDQYEVFDKQGAMIIGISGQSVESHKKFAEKYHLNFMFLSDSENKIRSLFGVPSSMGMLPGRVTYVADLTGKVVYVFNSQTEPTRHVDEVLKILTEKKDL